MALGSFIRTFGSPKYKYDICRDISLKIVMHLAKRINLK